MSPEIEIIVSRLAIRTLPDGRNALDVAGRIAERRGVLLEEALGPTHEHEASAARHEFWFVLRENKFSYPRIGKLVGRDHTTVMSGIRKHLRRLCRVSPVLTNGETRVA